MRNQRCLRPLRVLALTIASLPTFGCGSRPGSGAATAPAAPVAEPVAAGTAAPKTDSPTPSAAVSPTQAKPPDASEAKSDKSAKSDESANPTSTAAAAPATEWTSLFDGKSLGNWQPTKFGGEGEVTVEDGKLILSTGNEVTGVTWKGDPPARTDYEIEVEAMRVEGYDFFCGLTFPVGADHCSLIPGGWSGAVTGLSSLDGIDASENETSQTIIFKNNQWYRFRVRVTKSHIECWVNDKSIIRVATSGRKIGIRGEVQLSTPLGIATWSTTGAIRSVRWRKV